LVGEILGDATLEGGLPSALVVNEEAHDIAGGRSRVELEKRYELALIFDSDDRCLATSTAN
jgi:hypothetical protein